MRTRCTAKHTLISSLSSKNQISVTSSTSRRKLKNCLAKEGELLASLKENGWSHIGGKKMKEGETMTEEETMEVTETFSAIAQLDERDTAVKESVVAYLMWHSGEVLDKTIYPNRKRQG